MTTSTKRIRVYDDTRAVVGNDVAAALGITTHHRQVGLTVVATSKREAMEIAALHGAMASATDMTMQGRVDPEHGDTLPNAEEAMREGRLIGPESVGACYAHGNRPGPVVDMTSPDRPVVGYLVARNGYGYDYRPADRVDRLRAALARVESMRRDTSVAAADYQADTTALALVLAAARTTLPREES